VRRGVGVQIWVEEDHRAQGRMDAALVHFQFYARCAITGVLATEGSKHSR
jgi:hypothetical protein